MQTRIAAEQWFDPQSNRLWFALGEQPPCVVCWDASAGLELLENLDASACFDPLDSNPSSSRLDWCVWYYLKQDSTHGASTEAQSIELSLDISKTCGAALAVCGDAPREVLERVGDVSRFGCWPTSLFYLSLKNIDPFLSVYERIAPIRPPLTTVIGDDEGPADVSRTPQQESDAHAEGRREGVGSFREANDRVIQLEPELATATQYALGALKQIASSPDSGRALETAPGEMDASRDGEAAGRGPFERVVGGPGAPERAEESEAAFDAIGGVTGQRLTSEELNVLAGEYLKKNAPDHRVTARELRGHLMSRNPAGSCSLATVAKLPAWRAYQDELERKGLKGKKGKPKAVTFTDELEATVGEWDPELRRLTEEQEADMEPSPLEDDPPDEPPRKVRERKRL